MTEKQQKFLDVLFNEAEGDFVKAKKLAGYSDNTPTREIVDSLEDEISKLVKKFLANSGVKAAYTINQIVDDPTIIGGKERLSAAKDLLDRGGFKATEKVEVTAKDPIFILPPKS